MMLDSENDDYEPPAYHDCDCDDDDNLPRRGYCTSCLKECTIKYVDNGIGSYEYWGAKSVDTQIDAESECCGAEVSETPLEEEETEDAG